jgi:hypothetical protein
MSHLDDAFLAVDLKVQVTADAGMVSYALMVGPPNGTVVIGDPQPYRSRIEAWCVNGLGGPALDPAAMPLPEFPGLVALSNLRAGDVAEGFILMPVNPMVLAAGHLQLSYASVDGPTITIRLRP